MLTEKFMYDALSEAKKAALRGEVPIGCVIVKNGEIIAAASNTCEETGDPTAHAEVLAIKEACRVTGEGRLTECSLYVTLEPCPMCTGAIINARIPEVYYGASNPYFGACGSVINLFEETFGHHPRLIGGILSDECGALLTDFFTRLRDEKK